MGKEKFMLSNTSRAVPELTAPQVEKCENGYKVQVWNRTYEIGAAPLFTSCISGGEQMLASPIRLVATSGEGEVTFSEFDNLCMAEKTDTEVTLIQSALGGGVILNTSMTFYYDGCVRCNIKVMPQGWRWVGAYGQMEVNEVPFSISKLWLEIPLTEEAARFYQFTPVGGDRINGQDASIGTAEEGKVECGDGPAALRAMNSVPEHLELPFKHQLYLGNDHHGLAVFFEDHKGWVCEDEGCAIECVRENGAVVLRLHFLDREPKIWEEKGAMKGNMLFPLHFALGIQATPVKPYPAVPYSEKNYQISDVAKLFKPVPDGDGKELYIDYIKRMGVDTLYFHECWHDLQNSFLLTDRTEALLNQIIEACHSRGMKLLLYFGYEISSLSPAFDRDFVKNQLLGDSLYRDDFHYYRKPRQSDFRLCYGSDYREQFLAGIEKIMDRYNFDGLYLDGTFTVWPCKNEAHGCGYVDENGKRQYSYPVWSCRSMVERLYRIVHKHGGTVNIHTGNAYPVPLIAFADSMWDGEAIQSSVVLGQIDKVPEGHFRSMYTGRPIGIPVYMICYTNPPVWTFHQGLANVIPFGVLPRANELAGLTEMSEVWKAFDCYPMEEATFCPYYENAVQVSDSRAVVSYYSFPNGHVLAIAATLDKSYSGEATATFPFSFNSCKALVSTEGVRQVGDNSIAFSLNGFDYAMIDITL